jgi:hypothetical protein
VRDLGIRYAVPIDNDFGTWNAWANRYWPANYLIDRSGHVRYVHFGEGEYDRTEGAIRTLLAASKATPSAEAIPDRTPTQGQTPETYLGWERLSSAYAGSPIEEGRFAGYTMPPNLAADGYAYGGRWKVEPERIVAGSGARLRIRYSGKRVHLVMTGDGTVDVSVDGRRMRRTRINGDRLYTLLDAGDPHEGLLELRFSPGVAGYAFTFG